MIMTSKNTKKWLKWICLTKTVSFGEVTDPTDLPATLEAQPKYPAAEKLPMGHLALLCVLLQLMQIRQVGKH